MANNYEIYIVSLNQELKFDDHLYLFSKEVREDILSYRNYADRLRAFASALLKYYFLADILALSPLDIEFKINQYGKPYLVNHPQIDFSIAHSGEFIVLAVVYGGKIGIDIEKIDKNIDLSIGNVVFSSFELAQINSVLDFYSIWVKKEAYLKQLGCGFLTDSYQNTKLTAKLLQIEDSYDIYTRNFCENYMLAVCVSK